MKVVVVLVMILVALTDLGLAGQRKKYCGPGLEKKLFNLCGGIYFKRSGTMGIEIPEDGGVDDVDDPFLPPSPFMQALLSGVGVRQRRGIVDECCHRGCTDYELSYYCG